MTDSGTRRSDRAVSGTQGELIADVGTLPDVASRDEVAAYLRISKPTIARWAMEGKGPRFRKAGGRVLYLRDDVLDWLDSLETGGGAS